RPCSAPPATRTTASSTAASSAPGGGRPVGSRERGGRDGPSRTSGHFAATTRGGCRYDSERRGLPIARSGCLISRFGSFLLRRLGLEIGRRGGAGAPLLLTFARSVHDPEIMLGMLV